MTFPKANTIKTDTLRNTSAESPVALTMAVRKRVKKVKLKMNPVTTPIGRLFPPVIEPERTIGRIGKIHGERIVTIPPKNEKIIRSSIFS